ncbi:hypothetical protein CRUP_022079, partial [Coryphaenoides rupestris]
MLQWPPVATEGRHGTNRPVSCTVVMDGGPEGPGLAGARLGPGCGLGGPEFILRVSSVNLLCSRGDTMTEDFSQSLTPPVSPSASDSVCELLSRSRPPRFCCASSSSCSSSRDGGSAVQSTPVSAEGYLGKGSVKRLLLRLDPAPADFQADTVEIFGFPWVRLAASTMKQRSSDNNDGPAHPYEEQEAQLPSALLEELFGLTLLIGRLKDLPASLQGALSMQNQGKIFPPAWHLLHLHLDVHWSVLEVLHLLGQKMHGRVVYAHRFVDLTGENLTDSSLFEAHLCALLCDLTGLAMGKYS